MKSINPESLTIISFKHLSYAGVELHDIENSQIHKLERCPFCKKDETYHVAGLEKCPVTGKNLNIPREIRKKLTEWRIITGLILSALLLGLHLYNITLVLFKKTSVIILNPITILMIVISIMILALFLQRRHKKRITDEAIKKYGQ